MKKSGICGALLLSGAAWMLLGPAACGSSRDNGFDPTTPDASTTAPAGPGFAPDATPGCVNLQCAAATCAGGAAETTLTGHVFDPAANLPLYNVYVYIPNARPEPIVAGSPTCTTCQAPASGSPVIGAMTDAQGKFTLKFDPGAGDKWHVPVGDNVPLVLQLGKWRRQVTIPHIASCATTDLDQVLGKDILRLPKKSSEGDMPMIAFTSGCDPAECFLRHLGIDDSEFVPPNSPTGHVHFYTGKDDSAYPERDGGGLPDGTYPASAIAGGNTYDDTYKWWTKSENLLKYDIVFNACECADYPRGEGAYAAMEEYLDKGGRVYTTHYHYNWFTESPDFNHVVGWSPMAVDHGVGDSADVNTTFPKGKAYADWLLANNIATKDGTGVHVHVVDTRGDALGAGPPNFPKSTLWLNVGNFSLYTSFNVPVALAPSKQCGRAVFSDVHLSGLSNAQEFPAECANPEEGAAFKGYAASNEKALEFLFFDISSCVQDDTQAPKPPVVR